MYLLEEAWFRFKTTVTVFGSDIYRPIQWLPPGIWGEWKIKNDNIETAIILNKGLSYEYTFMIVIVCSTLGQ